MLNPIEFTGMVQRTQDVSTIKQNENIKPQMEHINVQSQETQKAIMKHEQVIKKENADREQNNFDAKEKGNGMYYDSRNKKKKKNKEEGSVKKLNSGTFDVKA